MVLSTMVCSYLDLNYNLKNKEVNVYFISDCYVVRPEYIATQITVSYGNQLLQCLQSCKNFDFIGLQVDSLFLVQTEKCMYRIF